MHRQALHVRIGRQECRSDVMNPSLERGSAGRERRGVHEVLHRVGRDHPAVIASGVGLEKGGAVHRHLELRGHEDVVAAIERRFGDPGHTGQRRAVRAVDLHVGLAVVDLVVHQMALSLS